MVEILDTIADGDYVIFRLRCPSNIFRSLSTVLASLSELSHALDFKSRCVQAYTISPEQQAAIKQHHAKFEKLVKKHMQANLAAGLTFNQSVSSTLRSLKDLDTFNLSYDIVRTTARRVLRPR